MIIESLIVIVFFFSLGFLIISYFPSMFNLSILEKIGFSYGLGVIAVVFYLAILSFLGIPWSLITVILPLVIIIFLTCSIRPKSFSIQLSIPKQLTDKLLFFLIVFNIIYVVGESIIHPLLAWDGWATFFLVAKSFYLHQSFDPQIFKYADTSIPPALGFFIGFFYIVFGQVNDSSVLLAFSIFYIGIIILFYKSIYIFSGMRYALFSTFLVSSIPNLIRHGGKIDVGYGDLPLAYFFFCSFLFMLRYLKKQQVSSLIFINIFLSIGVLIKNEGIPFFIIINSVVFLNILQKKRYFHIFVFFISIFTVFIWEILKRNYQLPVNPFILGDVDFYRISRILIAFIIEFFNIQRWNFLWIAFIMLFFFSRKKLSAVIVVAQIFVYFVIYLKTPLDPVSHIQNSFDRLLIHVAPIGAYFISESFFKFFKNKKLI